MMTTGTSAWDIENSWMQSTRIFGDDKRHGYRGLYPLRAANLIRPDRVEARKGSIARLRLERSGRSGGWALLTTLWANQAVAQLHCERGLALAV